MKLVYNINFIPSPIVSGGPILRPGMRAPDQPLSIGLSFSLRNFVIESLIFINFSILKNKMFLFCFSRMKAADIAERQAFNYVRSLHY